MARVRQKMRQCSLRGYVIPLPSSFGPFVAHHFRRRRSVSGSQKLVPPATPQRPHHGRLVVAGTRRNPTGADAAEATGAVELASLVLRGLWFAFAPLLKGAAGEERAVTERDDWPRGPLVALSLFCFRVFRCAGLWTPLASFERSDEGPRLAIPCGGGVTVMLPVISGLG